MSEGGWLSRIGQALSANYTPNPFALPTAVVGFIALLLGIAVLIRGRGSRMSRLFWMVTLPIGIWLFAFSLMYCARDSALAYQWARAGYWGVPLIPVTIYHFTTAVLRLNVTFRNSVWMAWVVSLALLGAIHLSDAMLIGVYRYWWGHYPAYGWLSAPFLVWFLGLMAASLMLYLQEYRRAKPASTHQRRAAAFLLAFSLLNLGCIDYFAKYGIAVYPFGYLCVLGFLVFAIRAIWRYDVLELTPRFAADAIVATMGEALVVLDHEGVIQVVNEAACRLFGAGRQRLTGLPLAELDSRLVPPRTQQMILKGGAVQRYEVRLRRHPSDNTQTLDVSAAALRSSLGEAVGVVCLIKDTSERKRMEEALRVAESRFARLAESNIIGIIVVDLRGHVLEANDFFLQMMGFSREELASGAIRWDRMTPSEDAALNQKAIDEVRDSGIATPMEREYFRRDGSRISVVVGAALLEGSRGKCLCYVVDNTHRKLAEQKLRALNETLEQRVAERSAAAEYRARQLMQANQELDALTKELQTANLKLQELSLLDPLTELLNRRGLQQALTRELQHARRGGEPLLALLVDLDDFKQINDNFGYAVGDVVVKEVARKLKTCLRTTDSVARLGGDEFMILLPGLKPAEGMRVAEKVRLGISGEPIWIATGDTVPVTASLGLVSVSLQTPALDEIVSKAHTALYRSKQQGKNRVFCGDREGASRLGHHTVLVDVLNSIREGRQLHVVVQPIVALKNTRIVGFELLSRFAIESFEMPDDVFRVCLEANMLTVVDHQCFRACMATTAHFPSDMSRHINLFPSTIVNVPVSELLRALPGKQPVGRYCVELSEQQIIGESSHLTASINALKEAGVRIAVDDVGFGRSSLESLILLEPHIVKIDKHCVGGIAQDSSRCRSLKRLLSVADALGTEVVAEGIETPEDMELLKGLGVAYGQGYLLGRPADPHAFGVDGGNGHTRKTAAASRRSHR